MPLERAADCLKIIGAAMYGPEELWQGFRTASNIRFVSGEPFYLSPSNGGPVMYINYEDYVQPSGAGDNVKFDEVSRIFLAPPPEGCGARFHWGKAGWPKHLPCFDGAAVYPDTWCDFGCAVQELDPDDKFRTESNVWRWNATRGGAPTEFASCCTPQGFDKAQCQCAPAPACGTAPQTVAAGSATSSQASG